MGLRELGACTAIKDNGKDQKQQLRISHPKDHGQDMVVEVQ